MPPGVAERNREFALANRSVVNKTRAANAGRDQKPRRSPGYRLDRLQGCSVGQNGVIDADKRWLLILRWSKSCFSDRQRLSWHPLHCTSFLHALWPAKLRRSFARN